MYAIILVWRMPVGVLLHHIAQPGRVASTSAAISMAGIIRFTTRYSTPCPAQGQCTWPAARAWSFLLPGVTVLIPYTRRIKKSDFMNTTSKSFLLLAAACFAACASAAHAERAPFTAPFDTVVNYTSGGPGYSVWTISASDSSATAMVVKIKLPKQYLSLSAFKRYVANYVGQSWSAYGINFKATWRNDAYTVSGNSGTYQFYAKGTLRDGSWYGAWVVGQQSSEQTKALVMMVKRVW